MAHPLDQPSIGEIPRRDTSVVQPKPVQALVNFEVAYKQLMERWEDPHLTGKVTTDAGGKTRYGISQGAYPSLDIDTLTVDNAKKIAFKDYWATNIWDVPQLLSTNQALANKLFQFGFNSGVGTVVQLGNMCLDIIAQSESISPLGQHLTVSELTDTSVNELLLMLAAAQLSRYVKDYHLLSRVPHSLLDRALCIE